MEKTIMMLLEAIKNFLLEYEQPFRTMTIWFLTLAGGEMVRYFIRMALDSRFKKK